jgi:hypothetical protein
MQDAGLLLGVNAREHEINKLIAMRSLQHTLKRRATVADLEHQGIYRYKHKINKCSMQDDSVHSRK